MATSKQKTDAVFRAFADTTRLRILALLSRGEWCVGDLVAILKVPQPTASRHLAYLRRSGLALARKQEQWIFYRLAPAKTKFQKALFACLDCCGEETPEIKEDARRSKKLRAQGGCC